ncbi:MAG TPA: hypothetical protein VMZ92_02955, partial [Planctomycetota bacterium]|nr:hypothetical protein [Planctomycetota bacterium]
EDLDPVLTTWRYGLGKTAAWTSDLSPNWAAAWVGWEKYHAFVKQLLTDISRTDRPSSIYLQSFAEGNTGTIVVEDHHPQDTFLEIEAQVTGGRRQTGKLRLKQTAPRRYQAEFPLWGRGRYQIVVTAAGGDRKDQAVGGFVVPYSPEYLRFRSNPIVLKQIAERTGGKMLTGNEESEDIFTRDRKPRFSSSSIVDWFLLALACLIPLDVGVRRVQLDWYVIRGLLGLEGKRAPEETLGALLARKKAIEFVPRKEKPEGRAARPIPRRARRAAEKEAPPVEREPRPEVKPAEDLEGLSTTERLLARKKKWKKDT